MSRLNFVLLLTCVLLKGLLVASNTLCAGNQSQCRNENKYCDIKNCHRLQWYVTNRTGIESNSTLLLLPGQHELPYNAMLNVSDVTNFRLKGSTINNTRPSVICSNKTGGINFSGVNNVTIMDIMIQYCGIDVHFNENFSIHAALSFLTCFNVSISNIVISNSTGYGLHVDRVYGFINVQGSTFEYSKSTDKYRYGANARFYYNQTDSKADGSELLIDSSNFTHGNNRHRHYSKHLEHKRSALGSGLVLLIHAPSIRVTIRNITVTRNTARIGANIELSIMYFHENTSTISVSHGVVSEGIGSKGAGLMGYMTYFNLYNSTVHHTRNNTHNLVNLENVTFSNNIGGAVNIHLKQLHYIDPTVQTISFNNCTFVENIGYRGAAVTIIKLLMPQILPNNAALLQYNVIFKKCHFARNAGNTHKTESYKTAEESVMMLLQAESVIVADCEFIDNNVTGISLINSNLHFTGTVYFENNRASYGGALSLWDSSIIYLTPPTHVYFINNHANKMGGAIFIEQRRLDTDPPCFYQPVDPCNRNWNLSEIAKYFQLRYFNNKADVAGDALYGGGINYCFTISRPFIQKNSSLQLFNAIHDRQNQTGPSIVASNPSNVLFCNRSTNMPISSKKQLYRSVYPGETFQLFVLAVGQLNGAVPAPIKVQAKNIPEKAILSKLISTSDNDSRQLCQQIEIAIFTKSPNVTLEVRVDNFSANSISFPSLFTNNTEMIVSLKECPWIFEYNKTNSCDCNPLIKLYADSITCNIKKLTFNRKNEDWIGCTYSGTNSTETNITSPCSFIKVAKKCPSEYCDGTETVINSSNIDGQCKSGREGVLCGQCKSNHSLSLGQDVCISDGKCSRWTLVALLLVFGLAGVFLVFFLTVINFTVTRGTLYGLLCYVSMVYANQKPLFCNIPRPLNIGIAWLNLDFGINVCLYSGMNAYQKIWLEYFFIFYLLFLSSAIIFLSRRFIFFTRLVGRNVVSVISTILVLSYSKIARISIRALEFVALHTSPDDKTLMVWRYDGNVAYFRGKHLPLAIFAIIMLAIVALYLLALLFIQCLQRRSSWFVLRWVNKLRPFFDAHTGPCRDYYRFWPGFLQFCILAIFSLQVQDEGKEKHLYFVLAFCVFVFILACISPHGVYKKWPLNVLEFSFFLNLGFLSSLVPTLNHDGIDTKFSITTASVSIALFTFMLIVLFHCYQKISSTKRYRKLNLLSSQFKRKRFVSYFFLNINSASEEYSEFPRTENERTALLATPTSRYNDRLRETLLSDDY